MADMLTFIKYVLLGQLFFSLGISIFAYSMPSGSIEYVDIFAAPAQNSNIQNASALVTGSVTSQTNIPLIDLGALVFYSGNIILDLLLNFAFAIPEMIALLINGVLLLFGNPDAYMLALVQGFASAVIMIVYMISLLQMITNIRSRGTII